MELLKNKLYLNDIRRLSETNISWEALKNAVIVISGAYGMIGSFLIDTIMYKNINDNLMCKIYAVGRDNNKSKKRFGSYLNNDFFEFKCLNINDEILSIDEKKVDFVFHLASNTHPVAYSADPVGTIMTNIVGTEYLLKFAKKKKCRRFLFTSSVEIYGQNRGDCDEFEEDYCGYIDSNTLRAGYPESKRAAEALCQAYINQENMDIVIARLSRIYGPTMLMTDTKASSQFILNGVNDEDIVLKSEGKQFYSYCYVMDAVKALLYCLFYGIKGEAYNVSDEKSNITLREMASIVANYTNKNVIYEIPNELERKGYSKALRAVMSNKKIKGLGWSPEHEIKQGVIKTIDILKSIR